MPLIFGGIKLMRKICGNFDGFSTVTIVHDYRWWQLIFFWNFHPEIGEHEPILTN